MLALLKLLMAQRAVKYVAIGAALLSLGYCRGKDDANARHARQAAKDAAQWAEQVSAAKDAAFERGMAAAWAEAANRGKANAVKERAQREPRATDECLSSDVVDGLRELQ